MRLEPTVTTAQEEFVSIGPANDPVNSPTHYNVGGIEAIEAIIAATNEQSEGYFQGNIMKYIWRYRYKNGIEDLKKAQWYLNKLIELYEDKHK